MDLSGKIATLLHQNHFVTINDLSSYASQKQIRVAFLEFGRNNQKQVVCSVMARKKQNQGVIAGTFMLSDIVDMQKTNNIQIQSILPLGTFDQNYQLDQFLSKICKEPTMKKGDIIPRKVRTRIMQKQSTKIIAKKQSQTQNNGTKVEAVKTLVNKSINKQNKNQKVPDLRQKSKLNLQQQEIQVKKQQVKKDTNLLNFINKKISKSQTQSEDEAKLLQKFQIMIQNKQKKQQNELQIQGAKSKFQQCKEQIVKKLSDLQLDEQQQYQLILKKQKMKIENKNTNIIQKIEKKTTDRLPGNKSTSSKPKLPIVQPQTTKVGNQATLFKYINKK